MLSISLERKLENEKSRNETIIRRQQHWHLLGLPWLTWQKVIPTPPSPRPSALYLAELRMELNS